MPRAFETPPLPYDQAHCLLYMACRYTRRKRLLDITEYKPSPASSMKLKLHGRYSSFIDHSPASLKILQLHRSSSSITHDVQASSMKLDLHPSYSSFIDEARASSVLLQLHRSYFSVIDEVRASLMIIQLHPLSSSFIHHPASSIVLESARGWRTVGDTLLRLSSFDSHYL